MVKKYYQILEVNESASEKEIKQAYYKLALKYHPDRGTAADSERFKEIATAHGVLSDPKKRILYDLHDDDWENYFVNEEEIFTCAKFGCGKKFKRGEGGKRIVEGARENYFCSQKHLDDYQLWEKNQKEGISGPCLSCENDHKNTGVPKKCELIINGLGELQYLGEDDNYSYLTSSEISDFEAEIKSTSIYFDLDEVKVQIDKITDRAKRLNKTKKDSVNQEKDKYIQQLKNLDGWNLLSEKSQDIIIEEIKKNRTIDQFRNILEMTKKQITKLRGGDGNDGNDKNLSTEIQKAIQEILAELNKEPKLKFVNEEWKNYIEISSNLAELETRKQETLEFIQAQRKQQGGGDNLTELRAYIIHLINQELNKNPSVSTSELINPNWEEEINQAQTKDAIMAIKTQVIANIKNIRVVKGQKNRLNELIIQAQQPENWDNYQNLENILSQIKELRSANAYQEKKTEIQALENRLQELDPSQYQKTSTELLDQQIKNNGLNESNMDEETKQAIAEAKQDPTLEKVAKAEEKIAQNGADNNLNNLVTEISNKLKKGNLTKKEKEETIKEILKFIVTENKYQKAAYQKLKPKVDALLAELKGEENNQENPPISWSKILGIATLIALPLIIIILIILRTRRRRLNGER